MERNDPDGMVQLGRTVFRRCCTLWARLGRHYRLLGREGLRQEKLADGRRKVNGRAATGLQSATELRSRRRFGGRRSGSAERHGSPVKLRDYRWISGFWRRWAFGRKRSESGRGVWPSWQLREAWCRG